MPILLDSLQVLSVSFSLVPHSSLSSRFRTLLHSNARIFWPSQCNFISYHISNHQERFNRCYFRARLGGISLRLSTRSRIPCQQHIQCVALCIGSRPSHVQTSTMFTGSFP
ncbi:hypothetical protein B0H13DRAFT_2073058 [Mycena leptocephala]|nr:hypothetical protein B0H13DRAFT_2073058 [Mycena leptocephala]